MYFIPHRVFKRRQMIMIHTHHLLLIGKTRQAEAKLCRIVNQYGVPPASARNLQAAIVQGTMLYASELTWNGQDKVEGPYQLAINRMARATLGVHQSTPRGIIMAESGFTLARALLDHRRARFAQRLYARSQGARAWRKYWKESRPSRRA